jgi:hypothetical protein
MAQLFDEREIAHTEIHPKITTACERNIYQHDTLFRIAPDIRWD